jgi:hypothetical protein
MTPNRCNIYDTFCIMFAMVALGFSVSSVVQSHQMDRSAPEAADAGLHLLSCPNLFDQVEYGTDDRYRNIRLSLEGSELLMGALKDSMAHARVVHTGNTNKRNQGPFVALSKVIAEQFGLDADQSVDVNVPRRSDSLHLCGVLKNIVDNDNTGELDSKVTISILKLEREEEPSFLLRGARMVVDHPLVDNIIVKLSDLDQALKHALTAFHQKAQASIPSGSSPQLEGEISAGSLQS